MEQHIAAEEKAENRTVTALARAMRNTSFYASDHPLVRVNIEEAASAVEHMLEKKREFVLKIVEGEIVVNDLPLFDLGTGIGNLIGACLNRDIESIAFSPGVAAEEIAALISMLTAATEEITQQGGAAASLSRLGASHIKVEKLITPGSDEGEPVEKGHKTYASALDVLRAAARRARMDLSPESGTTHQVVSELVDSIMMEQAAMLGMVSVKGRDEYTFTHALHICILCLELGHSLGLDGSQLQELGVCAMLHDIGKIFIPLPILRKPASLSKEEFNIIQQHPVYGALLLFRHEDAPSMAALVAFEHHRHYDLSGYPKTDNNRDLNFYSLMVGPADVYDALTTDRPYRPALPPQQALEVMQSQASHFEPRLLERFTEMLGKYPAGSLLRLGDGRLAVVTKPNPANSALPFVRILEFEDNSPRLLEEVIDLSAKDPATRSTRFSIDSVVDPTSMELDICGLLGGSLYCAE